uniref:Kinesin light chain n=1 Tax=Aplanochytrium stocchinoi TaxID=215587 RepID=A0A6S8C904_9STRA
MFVGCALTLSSRSSSRLKGVWQIKKLAGSNLHKWCYGINRENAKAAFSQRSQNMFQSYFNEKSKARFFCTKDSNSESFDADNVIGVKSYKKGFQTAEEAKESDLAEKQMLVRELYAQNNLDKAVATASECVELASSIFGKQHPVYASSLNNLALLNKEIGNYTAAIDNYSQSIGIYKEIIGYEHESTATAMNNLAETYKTYGDRSKGMQKHQLYLNSLDLLHDVLAVRKKLLGEASPLTGSTMQTLGRVLYFLGNKEEGTKNVLEGAKVIEAAVGEEDPRAATAWNNVGYHLKIEGKFDEALPWYEKAHNLREKLYGSQHMHTIMVKNNLVILI